MWTENLYDIRSDVNYMVKLIDDMRVDLKDFYNLELENISNKSNMSSNIASIESNINELSENIVDSTNDASNDDVIDAINRLGTSVDNLDSKIERNNELLSELIRVMKEKA
ncbi:MAG: hypothetical protein IKF79_05260 [Methanosphaera sp.]|nr:hypothetical protein [Methanosphaera sp.]